MFAFQPASRQIFASSGVISRRGKMKHAHLIQKSRLLVKEIGDKIIPHLLYMENKVVVWHNYVDEISGFALRVLLLGTITKRRRSRNNSAGPAIYDIKVCPLM